MALTANPLVNATSDRGDISSMKLFQDLNGPCNPTPGTTTSQAYAFNYIPATSANLTAINNLLASAGVPNNGYTALVVSLGNHQIFATKATGLPSATLPSGTTPFVSIYFDGNELMSSGNLTFP
jgi:hypothetical protein